ncbi:Activator of Hsp90 ATPase homolog 1-like protein [Chitinophaga sp. CF118]|uniref:SRPBCC domain-containing protein n=1 Tax=Chitinophaga sp. CF118 TaxID=1884367 RepID=UPI0008F22FDA|nr:SRPBCC domain-containing protein [Chitinophaga sp. CF118]SFE05348.1 Activator of Hsp90 ATPase homolog 1-like protein [Chitinophaga sp. CF118]
MATYTSTITTTATPQKVFEVLTKPELVKLWQFGKVLSTDWKTGSEIRFSTEYEGKVLEQWGTILEMRTNELIKYNLFTPRPDLEDRKENYCVTSYILTNNNDQTNIEIIQEDNRPNSFTGGGNLMPILTSLKNIAENS